MLSGLRLHPGDPGDRHQADPAVFLVRPEHHEARFLENHAAELDGVVLLGRHLAPYAPDSREHAQGLRGDELAQAVRGAGIDFVLDPDTAVLPYLTGDGLDAAFGRAELMSCARTVQLPLTADQLEDTAALCDLQVAVLAPQAKATYPSAAYFRFTSLKDPWLTISLQVAAMTQSLVRGGPIAVFVQVDLPALRTGALANAAALYADALGSPGLAFLQVAGLDVERADPADLLAYLHAAEVWQSQGFSPIADRVGRFGVAAVAAGAAGMACGTRVYRSVPDLELEPRFVRGGKIRYWTPARGDRLAVEDARARRRRGSIPACPVADCNALEDRSDADAVRWHNIHLTVQELALAQRDARSFAEVLRESPIGYVRDWGEVLDTAIRSSAQA
jgi:hypothetical protein